MYRHVLTFSEGAQPARDTHALHQLVMAGYRHLIDGDSHGRHSLNILFAAARNTIGDQPQTVNRRSRNIVAGRAQQVLVQAAEPGDWRGSVFVRDPHLSLHVGAAIHVPLAFTVGERLEFRVDVNATRMHPDTRKRTSITRVEDVSQWLVRQMEAGFDVHVDTLNIGESVRHRGATRAITHDLRHITGHVTVTDVDHARSILCEGIGRARAYGAGLIRYRPLNRAL